MNDAPEQNDYDLDPSDSIGVYCIEHFYDMGDQRIYIKRVSGDIDAKRAAIYCQFMCEEWFGHDKILTNLGVASLLVTFYGYQQYLASPCEMINDRTLYREKLYEFMQAHVIRDNDADGSAREKLVHEESQLTPIKPDQNKGIYCISHGYDVGNQCMYVTQGSDRINGKEAALFLQFTAEQFYGPERFLSNLGIAALLVQFYGFQQCAVTESYEHIDMYSDRESATTKNIYEALMSKAELQRDGLKEHIKFFLRPIE
jgi:hypothetical protein